MHVRLVCAALLSLALMACTKAQPTQDTAPLPPVEPCPFVYVYAPGNYIVDIASGSQVILDPGVQEFDLFCSPGEARAAVNEAVRLGILTEGDWRIYRLDGSMTSPRYSSGVTTSTSIMGSSSTGVALRMQ